MTLQRQVPGVTAPTGTACPDWLGLRREADTRARDAGSADLLRELVRVLTGGGDRSGAPGAGGARAAAIGGVEEPRPGIDVVDLGAGTGANQRYLEPRLPLPQRWTALDHDAEALEHPAHGDAERVVAGVEDLGRVLESRGGGAAQPVLVTCSALLDVLTTDRLEALAEGIVRHRCPALLALTVTGEVRWSPADPEDDLVREAFDGHQRRGGRPGPEAAEVLTRRLTEAGLAVRSAATPWRLGRDETDLLRRWLVERADAAVAQVREGAGRARDEREPLATTGGLLAWRDRRLRQLAGGQLAVEVGHVDLLILPPDPVLPPDPPAAHPPAAHPPR